MNLFFLNLASQLTSQKNRCCGFVLMLAMALFLSTPRSCRADMLFFNVQFSDVSSLGSNYSFAAELFDTGNGSTLNSTFLTFQDFSGQSNVIAPFTLSDSNPSGFNEATAFFSAGSSSPSPFSFNIMADFTPNAAQPDQFSFYFFNNSDNSVTNNLFSINFNSSDPNQVFFSSGSNANPNVPAPTIRVMSTPEPETWALMMMGLVGMEIYDWKRRKKDQKGTATGAMAL